MATPESTGPARAIVLASASPTRRDMLAGCGVPVEVDPAGVDEEAVRDSLARDGAGAADVAMALAELKAKQVSRRRPGALVVGADQTLECAGRRFDKPADLNALRDQLLALRGKRHRLHAAACAMRDGALLWHAVEHADLTMRNFSEAFLDDYVATAGKDALGSVGGYRLEGAGVQLFARIRGDYFTILGLPLLALLAFLRGHGVLRS